MYVYIQYIQSTNTGALLSVLGQSIKFIGRLHIAIYIYN